LAEDGATGSISMNGNVIALFGEDQDPLYNEAVAIVQQQKRASISLVQRHLHIGYNRAARLMEAMEKQGIVSAMQSNGNREVLVSA
jgi:S-DNA-T family DNA segregation ATPase FtsK/SpoIIIE